MRLLLDTHIVLDTVNKPTPDISQQTQALLAKPDAEYVVSVGKLHLSVDIAALPAYLTSGGVELLAINEHHVLANVEPEPPTRDPFDRLLLAQCMVEGLRLVTRDRALVAHPLALPSSG